MSELVILGSSQAVPAPGHANTHLVFVTPTRRVLVDCGHNPVVSMADAGLDVNSLTDIILTHFHPDHVGSLPVLLMDLWLLGRRERLNIYGLEYTIERAKAVMELYTWERWPDFYPVHFYHFAHGEKVIVLDDAQMRITASPVRHFLPNVCLRFDLKLEGKSVAYSCDSEPCQAIADIAQGADILLHEATGAVPGHSSAAQAGETASQAGAKALYLIHYAAARLADESLVNEARATFSGPVFRAEDGLKIPLG